MKKRKLLFGLFIIAFICFYFGFNQHVNAAVNDSEQMISEAQQLIEFSNECTTDENFKMWAEDVRAFCESYDTNYYDELKVLLGKFDKETSLYYYDNKVVAYLKIIIEEAMGETVELESLIQEGLTHNIYASTSTKEYLWTLHVQKYNEANSTNIYYDEIKKCCDNILTDIQISPSNEHIITAYLQFIYEEIHEIGVPDFQQLKEEFKKLPGDAAAADIIWLNHVQAYNEQNKDSTYYSIIAQKTGELVNAQRGDSIIENWIYAFLTVGEEVKAGEPVMALEELINEGSTFSYYNHESVDMIMWIIHVNLYNEANLNNPYYKELKELCASMLNSIYYVDVEDRNKAITYMKAYKEKLEEVPQLKLKELIQEGKFIYKDYVNSSNMNFNVRVYVWMLHINELIEKFSDDEQYFNIKYCTYKCLKAGSGFYGKTDVSYLIELLDEVKFEPVSSMLLSLFIQSMPDKYFYLPGETFDMAGAIINASYLYVYKDGSTEQVGKIVEDYVYEKTPIEIGETYREIYYSHNGLVQSIPIEIKVTQTPGTDLDKGSNTTGDIKKDNTPVKELKVSNVKAIKAYKRKKKIVVSWKKASNVTGYQYQFSSKKKFKGTKIYRTKKTRIIQKVIKKKKKYFVRVRSYKTVKFLNGQSYTIWGKWKRVVIKK